MKPAHPSPGRPREPWKVDFSHRLERLERKVDELLALLKRRSGGTGKA